MKKPVSALVIAPDWKSAVQWTKAFSKNNYDSRMNKSGIWFSKPPCFLSTTGTPVSNLDPKSISDAQAVITQYRLHDVSEKLMILKQFSHSIAWKVKLFL